MSRTIKISVLRGYHNGTPKHSNSKHAHQNEDERAQEFSKTGASAPRHSRQRNVRRTLKQRWRPRREKRD